MCKVCNKALCRKCAVEIDGFLFCETHAKMKKAVEHAEKEALGELEEEEYEEYEEEEAPKAKPVKKKPVRRRPAPKPALPKQKLKIRAGSTMTPAFVGAILGGAITGFPFINLLFPVWITLGGACAAYFLLLKASSEQHVRGYISTKTGAVVGAISGFFAAVIAILLNVFSAVMFSDVIRQTVGSFIASPELSYWVLEIVMTEQNLYIVSFLWRLIVMMVVFPILGGLGGALAAKLTK